MLLLLPLPLLPLLLLPLLLLLLLLPLLLLPCLVPLVPRRVPELQMAEGKKLTPSPTALHTQIIVHTYYLFDCLKTDWQKQSII